MATMGTMYVRMKYRMSYLKNGKGEEIYIISKIIFLEKVPWT